MALSFKVTKPIRPIIKVHLCINPFSNLPPSVCISFQQNSNNNPLSMQTVTSQLPSWETPL